MNRIRTLVFVALAVALPSLLALPGISTADQWPGFLGPHRDGHSPDTGLLRQWPDAGPPLLWKVDDIGAGWSSVAVTDDCVYTTGNSDEKQMLVCLGRDGQETLESGTGPEMRSSQIPRSSIDTDG